MLRYLRSARSERNFVQTDNNRFIFTCHWCHIEGAFSVRNAAPQSLYWQISQIWLHSPSCIANSAAAPAESITKDFNFELRYENNTKSELLQFHYSATCIEHTENWCIPLNIIGSVKHSERWLRVINLDWLQLDRVNDCSDQWLTHMVTQSDSRQKSLRVHQSSHSHAWDWETELWLTSTELVTACGLCKYMWLSWASMISG